ncbi:MAG: SusC/RagA family TonB-linked outer membrane protein [Cyclobacteriaceae bacterium]|nr:SusC/RagA family TonB-linked outer membrane protein [Cyclobacteriaceae bacterium]
MKMKFTPLFLLVLCLATTLASGQTSQISGKITSEEGDPLPGASIQVMGTMVGTVTNLDGKYVLETPSYATKLIISYIGYETAEVEIGDRSVIDYQLYPDIQQLGEIVVTAMGLEQEKRSLGYAVAELGSKEITQSKQPNVVNALAGQVSGVQITNSGGAPGMSSRIIIRGITSLNPNADNQPLFVVDGVPIDNSTSESVDNTPRGLSNRAADINPNDIENISVLKGAAATALYGVRAANGAVIITTKKGKRGAVSINVKSSVGFDQINKYPDFQEQYGQGFSGDYSTDSFWPSWGAPIVAGQVIDPSYKFYDNTRNVMQTGKQFDNYISVSGGDDYTTFFGSVSNFQQEGVIPFSTWDRTSVKLSGDVKVSDKFNFSGSLNYIKSGGDRVPHDRIMETLMYWAVTQDATDYLNPDGTQKTYGNSNPLYAARFWTYEDDVNRMIGNINLNYKPLDWLAISYRLGTDYYSDQRTEIEPGPIGAENEVPISSTGFIEETRINSRDINSTLNLTINKKFNERFSSILRIGQDLFDRSSNSLVATGNEFDIPLFYHMSNTKELLNSQSKSQRRLIGVYGDLMLNFDDMLYLNFTGRNDWTSTLAKANRSFFYPSVSLGFVFDEVLNLPTAVSYSKFRASFAEVGKDASPYQTAKTYESASGFPLNGELGYTRSNVLGSPELRPERTTSLEFGLEASFLQNRLGFDLTWYQSNSKDQIIPVPVSNATGFTRLVTNAGELENKGIELVLNGTPISTLDFEWDIRLNFTRNSNTVVSIREGIESIPVGSQFGYVGATTSMILNEGDPYGNLYGTSYERYYADGKPEELEELDRDLPLLIDDDGFPTRNGDQLIIGNAQPKWMAGLSNSFTYKGINLSFLIDVRYGIDQFDQYGNFYSAFGFLDYSLNRNDVVIFDGFLENGSANTKPVWLGQGLGPDYANYGPGFYRNDYRGVSENFVKDASFIKLRNITLGYDLPASLLDSTPIKGVNFSISANNILLWTPWKGFDPESFSAGASGNATAFTGLGYPGVQSYFFTLNLTF